MCIILYTSITALPEKVQRLSDLPSSPSNGLERSPSLNPTSSPSHPPHCTPSRHSSSRSHLVADNSRVTRGRKRGLQEKNGTISLSDTQELMDDALSPSAPYSASPSPPSPPHSPTSPSSHTTPGNMPQKSPSRLGRDRVSELSMGHQSPLKHKHDRTTCTQKTPKKQEEGGEYPTTPSSATRYKRALDISTATPEQRSPKHSRASMLERFDAVYHGLTSRSEEEVNYWETGWQEGEWSPALDRHSRPGSDSTPAASGVLTRAPAGPYITVTGSNGERVYMRLHKERVSPLATSVCMYVTVLYMDIHVCTVVAYMCVSSCCILSPILKVEVDVASLMHSYCQCPLHS